MSTVSNLQVTCIVCVCVFVCFTVVLKTFLLPVNLFSFALHDFLCMSRVCLHCKAEGDGRMKMCVVDELPMSLPPSPPLPQRQRIDPHWLPRHLAPIHLTLRACENCREFKRKTEALRRRAHPPLKCLLPCMCVSVCVCDVCVWLDCVSWEASETNLHSLFIVMLRLVTSLHWNQVLFLNFALIEITSRRFLRGVFSHVYIDLPKANNFWKELFESNRKCCVDALTFSFLTVSDYEFWIYVIPPLETVWYYLQADTAC